jgi:dTDP-4-amino-4,6-dideoxygalactose transaminase
MKKNIEELAIFGGLPAFAETLHVGRPNMGNRQHFLERIGDMLDRRWFSNNGPYVQELERRIAEYLGVRHCIAVCNATVGLEIACRAVGFHGEVIVPSFTFVATAHALQWQEITPVFCDVDPVTHNINPRRVVELITPRTTGIVGVHLWGQPCNVQELKEISDRYHLSLLFDASHAFGCSYQERMIGNFGNAEVFSFHATKFFNTFEGGAITTNDDELARKIRLMTNFGFSGYDNVTYIGTNGKMNEASAAMGLTNLDNLEQFVSVNRRNYLAYRAEIEQFAGIRFLNWNDAEQLNYQYIVIEVDSKIAGISRDELLGILHAENILARRYFFPGCHKMEPYRSYFPHAGLLLPETERLTERVLTLPTGTGVAVEQIALIIQVIRFVLEHPHDIKLRLEAQH